MGWKFYSLKNKFDNQFNDNLNNKLLSNVEFRFILINKTFFYWFMVATSGNIKLNINSPKLFC